MALTTTNQVMIALRQFTDNPMEIQRYDLLRRQVEAAVISYCKWPLEQDRVIEWYDGTGTSVLTLRRPFVSECHNVWLNQTGYAGQNASSAFDSGNLLTQGSDWMLDMEGQDYCKSGRIVRLQIASFWFPSSWLFLQSAGGLAFRATPYWQVGQKNIQVEYTAGFPGAVALATPFVSWAASVATFTTSAAHGFSEGMPINLYGTNSGWDGQYRVASVPTSTTFTIRALVNQGSITEGTASGIPQDIQAAVEAAVGIFRNSVLHGWPLTNESLGDYSYGLSIQRDPEFLTVRQLLSAYRDIPLAAM